MQEFGMESVNYGWKLTILPAKFFNKVMYAVIGILNYFKMDTPNIHRKVNVFCDDKQIPLRQAVNLWNI